MNMTPPSDPKLVIEDLCVTYRSESGNTPALRSFTTEIDPGEVLALVGESGSGKSTAGFAIGGLLPRESTAISGRISVGKLKIGADERSALRTLCGRQVGFVFQEPSSALHPAIKIKTQISESIHEKMSRSDRLKKVSDLLQTVHLKPDSRLLNSYPHHLSGGMQQRVVLAMAIANRPEVLVADEPTTALDPTIRREILALIRELASRFGSAVLLITHDFGIVSHYADRVAVLFEGKVVESGGTREILRNPQHKYTKELIESARGG